MRIKSARIVRPAIDRECLTLPARLPIAEAAERIERHSQKLFPVVDDQQRLVGVLSKSDLLNPPKPQLILVDHNELAQAVVGAEEADILKCSIIIESVVGSRRLSPSNSSTIGGSTCTLVARQFRGSGLTPSPGSRCAWHQGSSPIHFSEITHDDERRSILSRLATIDYSS